MKNLADLNKRKEMLQKDISELEDKFTFKNPKESLSTFTNGFTDQFLTDKVDQNGKHKVGFQTKNILSFVTGGTSDKFINTKTNAGGEEKLGINTPNLIGIITENAMKFGAAAFVTKFAKKSIRHRSWKRKIIGVVIIYLAPFLLRFVREKLNEFQQKEVLESLNKII